jgi:hypothetical protein
MNEEQHVKLLELVKQYGDTCQEYGYCLTKNLSKERLQAASATGAKWTEILLHLNNCTKEQYAKPNKDNLASD